MSQEVSKWFGWFNHQLARLPGTSNHNQRFTPSQPMVCVIPKISELEVRLVDYECITKFGSIVFFRKFRRKELG